MHKPPAIDLIRALGERVVGYSEAELGRKVGVTRERIRQIVHEFDLPYRPRNQRRDHVAGYDSKDEKCFYAAFRTGIDRLVALTDVRGQDECWPWKGSIRTGYGLVYRRGFAREYAHRVVYRSVHGPIRKGFEVIHTCGHGWCVNPRHLYAERRRIWVHQMLRLKRGSGWCVISDDVLQLTPAKLRAIKRAYALLPKRPLPRKGKLVMRVADGELHKLALRFGFNDPRKLQRCATGRRGAWILEE